MRRQLTTRLQADEPVVMGILNVTPDSFSDGGRFTHAETALFHAQQMCEAGAEIIDIGGESTRPGAQSVSAEEELTRILPVIKALREESDVFISVDTSKPDVMQAAMDAGADMVNDVRALREEGAMETAASLGVPVCLMHMLGEPRSMQDNPHYNNVVAEVKAFLQQRIEDCLAAGIHHHNIIIDPGFGFGKTLEHNLVLFKNLESFHELGVPLLVGVSRKSMIGMLLDRPVEQRMPASISMAGLATWMGAKILRVHDVRETVDAVRMIHAIRSI